MIRVESLHVFPLKSGAGRDTASARVEAEGLADDRRMMVIDAADRCITARAAPALLSIRSELDGDTIVLSAPAVRPIAFERASCRPFGRSVRVWSDAVEALDAGDAVAEWLGAVIGRPCRLALKAERTLRPLSLGSGGVVSFADTAPLLLTTKSSLDDLNRYLEDPV